MRESELRGSTVEAIRWRLSYVLLPHFKDQRLSDITVAEVDRYRTAQVRERDRLAAAKARDEEIDRRPLSNSTINRTIGLLAQILDVAVEYGHIPANPATGKRRKLKAAKPQRAYVDSAAQITALLEAAGELDRGSRADRQHVNRRAQLATFIFAGLRIPTPVEVEDVVQVTRSVTVRAGYVGDQELVTYDKGTIFPVHSEVRSLLPADAFEHTEIQFTKRGRR